MNGEGKLEREHCNDGEWKKYKSEQNNDIVDEPRQEERITIYNLRNDARVGLLKSNFVAANLISREWGIRVRKKWNKPTPLDNNAIYKHNSGWRWDDKHVCTVHSSSDDQTFKLSSLCNVLVASIVLLSLLLLIQHISTIEYNIK